MGLIDFILNVAGLLVWLNWRSGNADPFATGKPSTLSGTVRPAEPVRLRRWHHLAALVALLVIRAIFYWQIGPAVSWTPKIDLFFVALGFRGTLFMPSLLFSFLSFLRAFLILHFWFLTLSVINHRHAGSDPLQKMISLQLGRTARWPNWAQLLAPLIAGAVFWIAIHPLLTHLSIAGTARTWWHLAGQSLLVGLSLVFSLKVVFVAVLLLHLVASYVYFGKSPVLDFVELTARNLLAPLNGFSLAAGRVNFAPMLAIGLVVLVLDFLPAYVMIYLSRCNLTVWPQ
ncbi:MAG: hypothetical protein U1F65_10455 [Verrucomicrobiota bacterium]